MFSILDTDFATMAQGGMKDDDTFVSGTVKQIKVGHIVLMPTFKTHGVSI